MKMNLLEEHIFMWTESQKEAIGNSEMAAFCILSQNAPLTIHTTLESNPLSQK